MRKLRAARDLKEDGYILNEALTTYGIYHVFLESNSCRSLGISTHTMINLQKIVEFTVQGIARVATELASTDGITNLTAEQAKVAYLLWADLQSSGDDYSLSAAKEFADNAVFRFLDSS